MYLNRRMRKGIYAASLDPITFGHINIIERALRMFDELIVAIGINPDKKYMFSLEERIDMAQKSLEHIPNVKVVAFNGLLVDFAYEQKADAIIKGVRDTKDFSYEQLLHQVGESQRLGIETILLFAKKDLEHVSSSVVKAIQKEQGFIHEYVPLYVKQRLEERISGQYIVGLTGVIGAGKSYIGNLLVELGGEIGIEAHNIELDNIGHQILGELTEPVYVELREKIAETFGREVMKADGFIDRKVLGEIVFKNPPKMEELNKLMYTPLLMRLRRELYGKRGIMILNAALLVELRLMHLCNNNVVIVKVDKFNQEKRLRARSLRQEQINHRLSSQYDQEKKEELCRNEIFASGQGGCRNIVNGYNRDNDSIRGQIRGCLVDFVKYFGIKEVK